MEGMTGRVLKAADSMLDPSGDRPQNGQTAKEHSKSWFTLDRA